jgi:hypothetical protein
MAQKYIEGDIVMYDNKIMVVKEPRDGNHFDLSCPKERLVYCFVGVDEIKPVSLTIAILEKNGWELLDCGFYISPNKKGINVYLPDRLDYPNYSAYSAYATVLRSKIYTVSDLQHLLFGLGINHEMEV